MSCHSSQFTAHHSTEMTIIIIIIIIINLFLYSAVSFYSSKTRHTNRNNEVSDRGNRHDPQTAGSYMYTPEYIEAEVIAMSGLTGSSQ